MPAWSAEKGLLVEGRLKALGFLHGVTTRSLGNMRSPQSRDEALALAGVPQGSVAFLKQVHGRAIWHWPAPAESWGEGDGWIADRPGAGLGIFAADCLPLFLWGPEGRTYGLAHVGWRGAVAGMPRAMVETFRARGVPAGELSAGLGPSIRGCCYCVGSEVAQRLSPEALRREKGAIFADLARETAQQLVQSGVRPDLISDAQLCTHCSPDRFFSFRREKSDVRMMAFLFLPHPGKVQRRPERLGEGALTATEPGRRRSQPGGGPEAPEGGGESREHV